MPNTLVTAPWILLTFFAHKSRHANRPSTAKTLPPSTKAALLSKPRRTAKGGVARPETVDFNKFQPNCLKFHKPRALERLHFGT